MLGVQPSSLRLGQVQVDGRHTFARVAPTRGLSSRLHYLIQYSKNSASACPPVGRPVLPPLCVADFSDSSPSTRSKYIIRPILNSRSSSETKTDRQDQRPTCREAGRRQLYLSSQIITGIYPCYPSKACIRRNHMDDGFMLLSIRQPCAPRKG